MVERRGSQGAVGEGCVVRAAPNGGDANEMRALVLSGLGDAWEAGPRSAAELKEAGTRLERAAALCDAPVVAAEFIFLACCTKDDEDECAAALDALRKAKGGGAQQICFLCIVSRLADLETV